MATMLYLVSRDRAVHYSEIRGFLQKQPTMTSLYKSISVSGNSTVTLSDSALDQSSWVVTGIKQMK